MPNFENSTTRIKSYAFVDYKPAELRENKDWIIVYYAKNPLDGKLTLFRLRVPTMANKAERLRHAKRIVAEINNKLAGGWSPFLEETGKGFKSLELVISEFLAQIKRLVADDVYRPDTLRTYSSNLNLLNQFISESKKNITFAAQINRIFCVEYLEWIYIDRKSSPRTRNNHLIFLKLFCNYLVGKGVLIENPTNTLKYLKLPKKKRQYIPADLREKISIELKNYNDGFYCLCMLTYFCFVRNTEIGKLRAYHFYVDAGYIFIPKDVGKNKKDEYVTIPQQFIETLREHLKDANPQDYVFSKNKYFPGVDKLPVRKIQNGWDKLKAALKFDDKYQFYSLKDTGITDLLNSGVPAIKVRDQARHHDIKITELYTPRNSSFDESIRVAKIQF